MSIQKVKFFGSAAPFSNFFPSPFTVEDRDYQTAEHFFQAAKFWKTDPEWAETIRQAESPGEAKRLGGNRAHPIHPDWDIIRDAVMRVTLTFKFDAHPTLRGLLLGTGDAEIIEESPYDSYWGCGKDGTGQNRLGILLMEYRGHLRFGHGGIDHTLAVTIGHPMQNCPIT